MAEPTEEEPFSRKRPEFVEWIEAWVASEVIRLLEFKVSLVNEVEAAVLAGTPSSEYVRAIEAIDILERQRRSLH